MGAGVERGYKDVFELQIYFDAGKIKIAKIEKEAQKKIEKQFGLAGGERDTMALVYKKRKLLVFCDDKRGITVCKTLGIKFTTALEFLGRLFDERCISKEKSQKALDRLRKFAWYAPWRIEQIPTKILGSIDEIQRFNGWPKARLIEQAMHFGVRRLALDMAVDLYAEGKIDLSRAASLANFSVGEMMEVLARRGVGSQLSEEDYFLAEQSAREFVRRL